MRDFYILVIQIDASSDVSLVCITVFKAPKFKACIMLMFDAFLRVLWHVFLVRL
jgi:hypothetical protein